MRNRIYVTTYNGKNGEDYDDIAQWTLSYKNVITISSELHCIGLNGEIYKSSNAINNKDQSGLNVFSLDKEDTTNLIKFKQEPISKEFDVANIELSGPSTVTIYNNHNTGNPPVIRVYMTMGDRLQIITPYYSNYKFVPDNKYVTIDRNYIIHPIQVTANEEGSIKIKNNDGDVLVNIYINVYGEGNAISINTISEASNIIINDENGPINYVQMMMNYSDYAHTNNLEYLSTFDYSLMNNETSEASTVTTQEGNINEQH